MAVLQIYNASNIEASFTTLLNMTATGGVLTAIAAPVDGELHTASAVPIVSTNPEIPFTGASGVTVKSIHTNISEPSSIADKLLTYSDVADGDRLTVLLDDLVTYREFEISGITKVFEAEGLAPLGQIRQPYAKIVFNGSIEDITGNYVTSEIGTPLTYSAGVFNEAGNFTQHSSAVMFDQSPLLGVTDFTFAFRGNTPTGTIEVFTSHNFDRTLLSEVFFPDTLNLSFLGTLIPLTVPLLPGTYQHIIITRVSDVVSVFIDNVLSGSATVTGGFDPLEDTSGIGYMSPTVTYGGAFDNFEIYRFGIDATDVNTLFSYPLIQASVVGTLNATKGEVPSRAYLTDINVKFTRTDATEFVSPYRPSQTTMDEVTTPEIDISITSSFLVGGGGIDTTSLSTTVEIGATDSKIVSMAFFIMESLIIPDGLYSDVFMQNDMVEAFVMGDENVDEVYMGDVLVYPITTEPITDFLASDDRVNLIIMTFSESISTLSYDLYRVNVDLTETLVMANIISGYVHNLTGLVTETYLVYANTEFSGIIKSNTDTGTALDDTTPPPLTSPSPITNFSATDDRINNIQMNWTMSTGNPTPSHDLYVNDILTSTGVTSPYNYSIINSTVTAYVIARNSSGSTTSNADSGTSIPEAPTAPPAVFDFAASDGTIADGVQCTWTNMNNTSSYDVWKEVTYGAEDWEVKSVGASSGIIIPASNPGAVKRHKVVSVNSTGSTDSNIDDGSSEERTTIPISDFVATDDRVGQIMFTFTADVNAESHNIYENQALLLSDVGTGYIYYVDGLYTSFYHVGAIYDGGNTSIQSNIDEGTSLPAPTPGNVTVNYNSVSGSNPETVTGSNGVFNFTPPANVTSVNLSMSGGGGAGGRGRDGENDTFGGNGEGGYGGGAGASDSRTAPVTPGTPYNLTVSPPSASGADGNITSGMGLTVSGGARGTDGLTFCGDSGCNTCSSGKAGSGASGGAGGLCGDDSQSGTIGSPGGVASGGGGGGGGGGGMYFGDPGGAAAIGGVGGEGIVTISW